MLEERSGLSPERDAAFGLGKERQVIAQPGDATYEICWPVVVCFAVRGDPFPQGPPSTSTISERSSDSAFMCWVRSESHAEADYVAVMAGEEDFGRELRHWVVSSHEAHLDVAALDPPIVKRLGTAVA